MKLTNISLAILVAIGLVACGGSDNKNNPVPDPEPKPIPGNDNPPPPPPKGDSGLDPKRVAPGLTVPDDMKAIVAANKRLYVDRNFSDTALGYSGTGFDYDSKLGTDPEDVRLTSTYNFLDENDVITQANAHFDEQAVGAIYVGESAEALDNNAFVKTKAGYVRVAAKVGEGDKTTYNPNTKFYPVKADGTAVDDSGNEGEFEQKDVVFIANASSNSATVGGLTKEIELGKDKAQYDANAHQVRLQKVKVFGQEYDATTRGQNLDFGQMTVMKDIQTEEVTGSYQIINNKGTTVAFDNTTVSGSVKLGNIKAYNLPYSIAFVTTNLDEKKPAEKDIFNLKNNGAFQVLGSKTVALPQNGRTFYKGKSFSANATGDVTLFADLFEDRAGIEGVIDNRKDSKGNELATLTLEKTQFQKPNGTGIYDTHAMGTVKGAPGYANKWRVQLYGPDAEEAAGTIYKSTTSGGSTTVVTKEVFNTQREGLTNQSNDSTVTP